MKKRMFKRLLLLALSVLVLTAVLGTAATAQAASGRVDVSSASQLEKALGSGAESIRITADFELDRTFYVYGKTTIYSDEKHTLTRSKSFGGDIFVVGETSKGKSALLEGGNAVLSLGKSDAKQENLLTFNGNKANMKAKVNGSFIFICNSSIVNIYNDISFLNCAKTGNIKTLDTKYGLSYPNRIGGAVGIIASGSMNIYGGSFSGNTVNDENSDENAPESERNSSQGGAIYNFGNLRIYGGTFSGNKAARGGAIYNYRTLKITQASFIGNRATTHGGAILQPGSQYARIYLGNESSAVGNKILFKENTADENGGAVYTRPQSALVIYGDTFFTFNSASGDNGGAICAYGVVTLKNTAFENNSAGSRGGAIYLSNSDAELTTRLSSVTACSFLSNSAKHGGALAAYASDETLKEGAKVTVSDSVFKSNSCVENGGAVYAARKSTLKLEDSLFESNSGLTGGALYISDKTASELTGVRFISNTASAKDGCGGAVAVRSSVVSIKEAQFSKNSAEKNGGAVYISYLGTSNINTQLTVEDVDFTENTAGNYGGAVYATKQEVSKEKNVLEAKDCLFGQNEALKGGALYLTSGTGSYYEDVVFEKNTNVNTQNDDEEDFNGGAIYLSASNIEINGAEFNGNTAKYNGGAIGAYSESKAVLNDITARENTAVHAGGFLYNSGSTVTIYNSKLKKNASEETGGALSLHSHGTTNVYKTAFEENSAGTHGGAAYVYTEDSTTLMQDCSFKKNTAKKYGGAVYVSKASILNLYDITATENQASNGGVLYETTTATTVTLNGITVKGNKADKGPIIFGNTNKAILNLNKANYVDSDLDGAPTADYWSTAIANKLKVNEISDSVPSYKNYKAREKEKTPASTKKKPVSVNDVFNLGKKSSDADIDKSYASLKKLDNSSNFMSRNTTAFDNINGKTVTVDTFVYIKGHKANNVSVGEGLLIYQALLYKKAHPKENVSIDISSFRFSVEAAVNINRNSRYFGYMRNLVGKDYDEYGFVRISYLLVTAAKMGINVTVIGQMDGYPISASDPDLEHYFTNQLNDPCDPNYVKNGVIGDYLNFKYCYWTSYDDNDATDMMHVKLCAVSHYLDMNGKAHKNAVWSSSSNLDGIKDNGVNGNSKMQTATIVSDHEKIYRASSNYLRLIAKYCDQEDVYLFRNLVNERTTKQIKLILEGKESKIPSKEQIVYLGGKNDPVFELYFAPFGGDAAVWDEVNNPYCKYLRKMYNSDDYILFTWNNANYNNNFPLGKQMENVWTSAFLESKNPRNRLYVNLENFDGSVFDRLVQGKTVGFKSVNQQDYGAIHSKDMQLSYSENGQRQYVSLMNSLNIHGGSMSYQANNLLVIKEDNMDSDSVFYTVASLTTKGIADNLATESDDLGRSFDKSSKFPVGKLSAAPYTLEATVQVPESMKKAAGVIVGNYDAGKGKQLNLEIVKNGKVKIFFSDGQKKSSCTFSKDIRSESPVHIAVTLNGTKASLYINGKYSEAKNLSLSYSGAVKSFVIGGDNRKNNSKYFKGKIYSVSLFSDVRTKDEIEKDAVYVSEKASGLIYTTDFRVTGQTYSDVSLKGRTFSKSNAYSLGKLSSAPYTIEATVSVPENLKGRGGVIVGSYNGGKGKQLNLEVYKQGKIRLFFNKGKTKVSSVFDVDIRTGAPVDIAVTVKGNTASLYLNGKLKKTNTLSGSYNGASGSFRIGGDNRKGNSEYFKGTIYSVRLFSDVRTAEEIKKDYVYTDGSESGLIASRNFASQKKVYPSSKLTGRAFDSDTPEALGSFSKAVKTIEAVISVPADFDSRAGVIVGNYDNSSSKQLNLEIIEGGKVKLFYRNGSAKSTAVFSKDIRSERPVHIAVTLDGKDATLYVDGIRSQTLKLSKEYKGVTDNFKIGADNRPGNTQYFKGRIYSVSLFSSVRTAKQIKRDVAAVKPSGKNLLYTANLIEGGKEYEAVAFTGAKYDADTYTSLENLNGTPYTVEALIKVPKSVTGNAGVIFGNYNNSKGKQLNIEISSGGKVKLFFNNSSKKVTYIFSKDIRSDRPVHIAVTVSGTKATLYVNGVKTETGKLSASYSGVTDNFKIGGDNRVGNKSYFKGTVYSVSVFSDVRTQKEIRRDAVMLSGNEHALLYSGRFYSEA